MQYIKRSLERKFLRMNGFFKAILVTGARQVGKTTMLRQLAAGEDPLAEIRQSIAEKLYGGLNSTPSLGIVEELAKDRERS